MDADVPEENAVFSPFYLYVRPSVRPYDQASPHDISKRTHLKRGGGGGLAPIILEVRGEIVLGALTSVCDWGWGGTHIH